MDADALKAALAAAIPFNRTLGIAYDEITPERAVLRLPDDTNLHNHVGGPHAGAIFSLGESASGAVLVANFSDQLATALPLAGSAEIRYRRVARGDVTATATLGRGRDDIVSELTSTGKAAFPIGITIADSSGETTSEMTVHWVLKRTT